MQNEPRTLDIWLLLSKTRRINRVSGSAAACYQWFSCWHIVLVATWHRSLLKRRESVLVCRELRKWLIRCLIASFIHFPGSSLHSSSVERENTKWFYSFPSLLRILGDPVHVLCVATTFCASAEFMRSLIRLLLTLHFYEKHCLKQVSSWLCCLDGSCTLAVHGKHWRTLDYNREVRFESADVYEKHCR